MNTGLGKEQLMIEWINEKSLTIVNWLKVRHAFPFPTYLTGQSIKQTSQALVLPFNSP